MKIGLLDVDNKGFPNLALMKFAKWHKNVGHRVEWYTPFDFYDFVFVSKIFTFTPDHGYCLNSNTDAYFEGGTGYGDKVTMPVEVENSQPDYSIYKVPDNVAYGFLTRGCCNNCSWCVVPQKEGKIRPYNDVEQIAVDGRKNLILMDNNILASGDYAKNQFEKIIKNNYRIDFNQAMDARLVDNDFAKLIAKTKWIRYIRFGCDTENQVSFCKEAIEKIRKYGYKGRFMLYTMIIGNIDECLRRVNFWRNDKNVSCFAQPFRSFDNKNTIPQWQRDFARWCNIVSIFRTVEFKDYEPRKGFLCKNYL